MIRIVKDVAGRIAESLMLLPPARSVLRGTINIVYYHLPIDDPPPHYLDDYCGCTLDRFVSDLQLLSGYFQFASLEKLLASDQHLSDGQGDPWLAVTFDDGLDLISTGVADVLEHFGVSATSFVNTSVLDNANLLWCHKLSAIRAMRPDERIRDRFNEQASVNGFNPIATANDLVREALNWPMKRKEDLVNDLWTACDMPPVSEYLDQYSPYFSRDGLKEWMDRSHSVGFHTHTHVDCSRLPKELLETEIIGPSRTLCDEVGLHSVPLAYPFGKRLSREAELEVFETDTIDSIFGIDGFCRWRTDPSRLERAPVEAGPHFQVFAKPLIRAAVRRS
jgi:peptidoglycan/xylan/chitin deacetylase (PgdA/CDA1 family)